MDHAHLEEIERVKTALASGDQQLLDAILQPLHPADIAEILQGLESREQIAVLKRLSNERAAEVLTEVDDSSGQSLLLLLTDREVVTLIEEMPSDDAADLMGALPAEKTERVGALLPTEDRDQLQELMEYDVESAGGIMGIEFVSVRADATVGDAIAAVRVNADDLENLQKIYVVSETGGLVGDLSVMDLILHSRSTSMSTLMNTNVISVPVDMDQEEVASFFGKYDEFTLPVVDGDSKLVGRITVDDIIDVIEEEASEDIAHIAGTTEDELGETSIFKVSRTRIPWLVTGLLGQVVAALIMSRFEASLVDLVVLTFFVPLIVGTAGSIGIQAAVVVVRELALGQIDLSHLSLRVRKELQVASVNGAILSVVLFVIVVVWQQSMDLAVLLCGSLLIVVFVAALIGSAVPLLFQRRNIDPAIATGPFITVINDIVGLSIYLSLASVYLSRG